MSVKVENLEHNMAKLTIEVEADVFDKALDKAYNRQKNSISIPGFRKGKVPRQMVEKMYGAAVFYEDAANIVIQDTYPSAYDESGLDIVSQPEVDIEQVENGKNFIYTAVVAVKPEVKLGKYNGITLTKIDTSVSDEEVDTELETVRQNNARIVSVERPVEMGDTANIDFEGFVDGVAFEGGKDENYELEIGSHSFIDTFEDQIVGKNIGDEFDVNVTFPEQYQAADLAGKPAVFKVKVNAVSAKELPEVDDEFVQDISESNTVAEYREELRAELQKSKEDSARREKEDEAVKKIVEKSEMDIPEAMIENQVNQMINEMANSMAQQGLSMEQYMQFTGQTIDSFKEQVRPDALTRIQSSLVLEQIAKDENIEVTDADVEAEMASMYGMKADDLKNYIQDAERENMKKDLAVQKALDFVMDNAKERAKAKSKKAAEATEE